MLGQLKLLLREQSCAVDEHSLVYVQGLLSCARGLGHDAVSQRSVISFSRCPRDVPPRLPESMLPPMLGFTKYSDTMNERGPRYCLRSRSPFLKLAIVPALGLRGLAHVSIPSEWPHKPPRAKAIKFSLHSLPPWGR